MFGFMETKGTGSLSLAGFKGDSKGAAIYVERITTLHNLLFYIHNIRLRFKNTIYKAKRGFKIKTERFRLIN